MDVVPDHPRCGHAESIGQADHAHYEGIERSLSELLRSVERMHQLHLLSAVEIAELESLIASRRSPQPSAQGGRLTRWRSLAARWLDRRGA